MDIVDVEQVAAVEVDIDPQTPPLFTPGDADIVIAREGDWVSTDDDIAVGGPRELPILTEPKVHSELTGNEVGLIVLVLLPLHTDDLLKGNHIGLDLPQHGNDPLRTDPSVESATFVNIVGGDAQSIDPGHALPLLWLNPAYWSV